MKTMCIIFSLLCVLLIIGSAPVSAQFAVTKGLKINRAYADNQADTTAAVQVGSYNRIGAVFSARDSVDATIYVESQTHGTTAWVVKDSLAVASTSNTGTTVEWVLRDNTVEKVPGVSNMIRFREKFLTGNGVTSGRYDLVVYLGK